MEKHITHLVCANDGVRFNMNLNECLEWIHDNGKTLVDIKYQFATECGAFNASEHFYTALVVYY